MVGVVGSSPIEPTNEKQYICKSEKGNPGYDTANYNRRGFGTALVGIFFVFAKLKKRG
jgi:hypothetical protein